jgi:predicted SprT family Zn-dependent metalloprotease
MNLRDAKRRALDLMGQHGLKGWHFEFGQARRQFGLCDLPFRRIRLSAPLTRTNSRAKVQDTILHEIAHALAGPGHHHDDAWRAIARSIGCDGERCYGPDVRKPAGKYVVYCPNCGYRNEADRWRLIACRSCCDRHAKGKYDRRYRLKYIERRLEKRSPDQDSPKQIRLPFE